MAERNTTERDPEAAIEPAKLSARVARDVVEDALLRLAQLGGRTNRRALLAALEASRAALERLERSELLAADHLQRFEDARQRVVQAAESAALADLPDEARFVGRLEAVARSLERGRQAAIDAIVAGQASALAAERGRGAAKGEGPAKGEGAAYVESASPFRVSRGVPRLLALPRPPLATRVDEAIPDLFGGDDDEQVGERPALAEEDTLAALLADEGRSLPIVSDAPPRPSEVEASKRLEVLLPAALGGGVAASGLEGELAALRRAARGYLEDIGANGNLRRHAGEDRFGWDAVEGFEARMCHALDALRALSAPFRSCDEPRLERPGLDVLDEALRYGRESLTADPGRAFARTLVLGSVVGDDAARAAMLALKQSPHYTFRAQCQALALAPSPAIDAALARLCEERDPALLRVALDAVAARGRPEIGVLAPLVEHVDDGVRARAYRALGQAAEREMATALLVDRLAAEEHDVAACAAVEALSVLGSPRGVAHARQRLAEELEEPGTLVTPARLAMMRLVGLAGTAADHELLAASYTGQTGEAAALGLHGHVELAAELHRALVVPGEPYLLGHHQRVEAAAALIRITGAPLLEPDGDRYTPSTSTAEWSEWWRAFAGELEPTRRYRWGRPYSALATVMELEADDVPVAVRETAALELAIALAEPPLRVDGLAVRQRETLGRLRASVEARLAEGTLPVGTWS